MKNEVNDTPRTTSGQKKVKAKQMPRALLLMGSLSPAKCSEMQESTA